MVASSALVAPSALADDNSNPAHVFEKVASYQAMQVSQGMSSAQASGRMAQKSGTAMFDTAYRSDSHDNARAACARASSFGTLPMRHGQSDTAIMVTPDALDVGSMAIP